jgi:cobalt-zinc-cadmium efflux system membrane fusion protein
MKYPLMKETVELICMLAVLLSLTTCHREKTSPGQTATADSFAIASEPGISVSTRQFELAGMELGGLTEFTYAETVNANGYLDVPPQNRSKIGTFLGGFVKTANLLPGDRVQKDQVLVTLENIEYLKLQQSFLEAKEQIAYLKSVYDAQSTLAEEKISSQRNHLQAKSDYYAMLANYESLEKQLQLIHIDPENVSAETLVSSIDILAPFNGYIIQMNVVTGMYLNPSDAICEIINPSHMHLELKVFEKDVLKLKKGQAIEFRIPEASTESYLAEIVLIGKAVEGSDRTISVHAHIRNEQALHLIPGMYVEAKIKTDEKTLSGLPAEALVNEGGSTYILVKKSDQNNIITFEKVPVKVGNTTEEWFEVINADSLIRSGQGILIKGLYSLTGYL